MLLNSESTIDIIDNKAMVSNISNSPSPITIHCNAGSRQVEYTAKLNRYGRVWYDPKAITKILSLYHSTRKYRVVFDSEEGNCFKTMLPGREVVFNVSTNGLYYHNTADRAIVLVNTVAENREGFNRREYEGAKAARRTLGLVGYPSERDFTNIASSNMIVNCPVTSRDIKSDDKIFSPDVPSMKGKPAKRRPEAVVSDYVDIPKEILSMDMGLEVSVNFMFVNKLYFLVSVRKRLKFNTIEYIPTRLDKELSRYVTKIIDVYKQQGFSIHNMYMDPEFNCLDKLIVGTDLNTTSARDNVPEIERKIQVMKEQMRAVHGSLTYERMDSRMIIDLGKYLVMMISAFQPKISLSRT